MNIKNPTLFMDIGNTRAHIYDRQKARVAHIDIKEALQTHEASSIAYISVNNSYREKLNTMHNWVDISDSIYIEGQYDGMGVDRRALALSRDNAILVDAGSAITVDRVINGKYDGGFIMLGIRAQMEAFSRLSPSLDIDIDSSLSIDKLQKTTTSCVTYGIISPIIDAIVKISRDLPVYFTGGDGEMLSRYIRGSIYDETLLFQGMIKAISSSKGET